MRNLLLKNAALAFVVAAVAAPLAWCGDVLRRLPVELSAAARHSLWACSGRRHASGFRDVL
jgi:hypothetical protein